MISKFIEGTRNCELSEGGHMHLEYYLLETAIPTENGDSRKVYGIEVSKRSQSACNPYIESDAVSGISESKEQVKYIIDRLIAYTVTPTSMVNVIDDLMNIAPCINS